MHVAWPSRKTLTPVHWICEKSHFFVILSPECHLNFILLAESTKFSSIRKPRTNTSVASFMLRTLRRLVGVTMQDGAGLGIGH